MKNKISALISKLGGNTAYSGRNKTMFINTPYNSESILAALVIITLSLETEFKLVINT